MSDLPIGSNPTPLSGVPLSQPQQTQIQGPPTPGPQDSMSQAPPSAKQSETLASNPTLSTPKNDISLSSYLSLINKAKSESRDAHQASQEMDNLMIKRQHAVVDDVIKGLDANYKALDSLSTIAKKESDEVNSFINSKNSEISELVSKQNEAISKLEKGNAAEKQQCEKLSKAYDTYKSEVGKLGPIETPEAQAAYDKLTADYQKAVDDFNGYMTGRSAEIANYNTQISALNGEANKLNQSIASTIEFKGLESNPDLAKLKAPTASLRSVPPGPVDAKGPPPSFVTSSAKSGVASLPKMSYSPVNANKIGDSVYNSIYQSESLRLTGAIDAGINTLNSLSAVGNQPSSNAVLNNKPLMEELFPDSALENQNDPAVKLKGQILGKMLMDAIFQEEEHTKSTKESVKADDTAKEKSGEARDVKMDAEKSTDQKKEIEKKANS